MIPKKIHWCWFGRGEKPALVKRCVESWEKYCPDYEIIEWNEDNFDVNCNAFVKEAYEQKKYAFVSDFARVKVLYEQGGIYMDTDMEVIKPLDENLLEQRGFLGFESETSVAAGIIASEREMSLFGSLLSYYKNRTFINEDGTLYNIANPVILTNELLKMGLKLDNRFQQVGDFKIYPSDYFYPLDNSTGKLTKTEHSYSIHWYAASWVDEVDNKKAKRMRFMFRIFGKKNIQRLSRVKHKIWRK